MTKIRERAFANRIEEYINDASSFDRKRVDSSLYTLTEEFKTYVNANGEGSRVVKVLHGLCFDEHIDVVMLLLDHAYKGLHDCTSIKQYSKAMAKAMQGFAEPMEDDNYSCYPYPYFLLHGIRKGTLAGIVSRFEINGRIIHETLAARDKFIYKYKGPAYLNHGVKMLMEEGATEDSFGICCYITKEDEEHPHGTDSSYIAKVSFFLDTSYKGIYIITIQGQRIKANDRRRSRAYARLTSEMEMDPRAFVLCKVCEIVKYEDYQRVRVIRPACHPMTIDAHEGFMARYEPIIKQAGIREENGCYLECAL